MNLNMVIFVIVPFENKNLSKVIFPVLVTEPYLKWLSGAGGQKVDTCVLQPRASWEVALQY